MPTHGSAAGIHKVFLRSLVGALLIPSLCLAEEGFHSNKIGLPPAVQAAWDSTFLVEAVAGKGAVGTAFVVRVEPTGSNHLIIYFLTANHVVQGNCGIRLGFCENIEISDGGVDLRTATDIDFANPTARANGAEVVRRSEYPDLALLRLVVADGALWNRRPLVPAQACSYRLGDAVYVIGFPDVASRTNKHAGRIDDRDILERRWSRGRILGPYHYNEPGAEKKFWTGITADGLRGNSGSPALNAWGEVVGELDSAGKENRGGAYLGNDSLGIPHAMLQRCEYLDDFINLRPMAYDPQE